MTQLNERPGSITSEMGHVTFVYRYYILLISLLLTLILPFFIPGQQEDLIWTVTRTLVLIACVNVLRRIKQRVVWILIPAVLTLAAEWFSFYNMKSGFTHVTGFILFGYFVVMITIEVFKNIIRTDRITMNIIMGAFCGFMLIGMIASLIYTFLHLTDPGSFSNVKPQMEGASDLFYFSFITLLTIGYGDIAPLTEEARSTTVFFGLIGQFYQVVIMAVLIGKFLSKTEN